MIPSGCKVPPVISRLPALVILLSALLILLACGQTPMPTPTMGLEPVATEVVTPPASEATVAERDGDDEVKPESTEGHRWTA